MAVENEELILSISADTRQILNAMKRLTGEIAKSTSGVQKQFDDLGRGIDKATTTAMQKRIDAMVGIGVNATKEWTGVLAEQSKEMERLRSRFNPVFSTINRYKSTMSEIRAAHRLGAISADEMAAAIQRERQAALASIAAIKQRNAVLADTPAAARSGNAFNTANIAAQFQDIGVTTAMGMNPLQIALQQGTQLSAILNQMGSGRDVIKGLGAAFMSIVNPISLVTIGTIAATTAAAQYFFTSRDGTDETAEGLKAQEQLIQSVAQAWGDVLPAIRAVAAERERLSGRADIDATTQQQIARVFKDIGQEVTSAGDRVTDLMDALRNVAPSDQLVAWQTALKAISISAAENKTTIEEMRAAQQSALDLYASTGIPVFQETAIAIEALIPRLQEARTEIENLAGAATTANAIADLQAAIASISSAKARRELDDLLKKAHQGEISVKELLAELARISGYAPDVSGIIGAFRAVAEAAAAAQANAAGFYPNGKPIGKASQGGRTRYGGSGYMQLPGEINITPDRRVDPFFGPPDPKGGKSAADSEAERARKAIDDVVASLRFEQQQLGRTGTAQRVYNELKRAGVDITSESGRQIAGLVTALEAERQAMEKNRQATEARAESIENLFEMGADAIGSIIDKSASAEDAVKKLAVQLALAAAQAALFGSGPLAGLFGGGGLNNTTNFIDGRGGGLGGLLGFATGTANTGGRPGQVRGLVHGQEAVIPLPNGGKVPVRIEAPIAPALQSPANSNMPQVLYAPNIDMRGASTEAVEQLQRVLARDKAEFEARVVQTVRRAQKTRAL